MVQVSVEEARSHLADLIASAINGESVFIKDGENQLVLLVPVSQHQQLERRPRFGSAKGLIAIADDFDEPLEDFAEYTP